MIKKLSAVLAFLLASSSVGTNQPPLKEKKQLPVRVIKVFPEIVPEEDAPKIDPLDTIPAEERRAMQEDFMLVCGRF